MHVQTDSFLLQFRSHSQEKLLQPTYPPRPTSSQSADVFSLVVPTDHRSSLTSLVCPICSLPMMTPTLLPCQHTFCLKCLQNTQQVRSGSMSLHCQDKSTPKDQRNKSITCPKCVRVHRINSLTDLEHNQSVQLLVNTLLCQSCHQLYPSDQIDTCIHCYGVLCPKCYEPHVANHENDLRSNRNIQRVVSMEVPPESRPKLQRQQSIADNKLDHGPPAKPNADVDSVHLASTKRKSKAFFRRLINPAHHRHSSDEINLKPPQPSVKRSASAKAPRRPKIPVEIKVDETAKVDSYPTAVPITPVTRFLSFNELYTDADERIKQYKHRRAELDRSVAKLVEVLTAKSNDTINQISQYWSYLKQFAFDHMQVKSNRFQVLGSLLRTCCSPLDTSKQMVSYFEQNDEIKAALQVLLTTLTIVSEQQTHSSISQTFDHEEQASQAKLRRHLDTLLSSYAEELSFINECVNVIEGRFATWRNGQTADLDSVVHEWSLIIERSYPLLIEKISNDFLTKTPQIERSLFEMLTSVRKRLLNADSQDNSQRSSVVSL